MPWVAVDWDHRSWYHELRNQTWCGYKIYFSVYEISSSHSYSIVARTSGLEWSFNQEVYSIDEVPGFMELAYQDFKKWYYQQMDPETRIIDQGCLQM